MTTNEIHLRELDLRSALTHPLPVRLWTAPGLGDDTVAPLLWCHDGSGYEQHAGLIDWATRHTRNGSLPPFRLVLADAVRRRQWYSVSPRYLRTFSRAVSDLGTRVGLGPLAVMGSSLGGLTSLAVGLADPGVGAVLSQSGSFFQPRTDGQETGFPWFARINNFVERATNLPAPVCREAAARLRVVITCGRDEENLANNKAMARSLAEQGFDVTTKWLPGGHDFDSWRLALDPLWSMTLASAWAAQR